MNVSSSHSNPTPTIVSTITMRNYTLAKLTIALSIGIYRFKAKYFDSTTCLSDPPITVLEEDNSSSSFLSSSSSSWNACNIFSVEYNEAREKFRVAVRQQNNAELYTLPILDDESLTIDVAILPGSRPGALLHSSGTHGVEGYAGSAIQLAFLESLKKEDDNDNKENDRPTIVLIHAINPYGMKEYRRPNEHNIDLNRNAIIGDFDEFVQNRPPNIANYETFRHFVSPTMAPSKWFMTIGFFLQAIPLLLRHGYLALKQVLVAGQYHHDRGIFFGGTQHEPSLLKLKELVESLELLDNDVDPLVWIDVHTGLGKFGKDTLMMDTADIPASTFQKWFPTAESIITPNVKDKKAMGGYELSKGFVLSFFQALKETKMTALQEGDNNDDTTAHPLFIIQEFGTLPGILVGRALILENAMHHHGNNKKESRQLMQTAFYPQSTKWRESIIQRGIHLIRQAIAYTNTQKRKPIT